MNDRYTKGVTDVTDSEWMTVSEMSEKINIPVESLRRYIRSHNVHLKVKKVSKKYYLHDDCVTVIKQIRTLYNEGKNVEEVEENLSASGVTMTLTVKNDDDDRMTVHVADELKAIRKQLDEQKEFNKMLLEQLDKRDQQLFKLFEESQKLKIESVSTEERLESMNQTLLQKLDEQQKSIEESIERRDRRLMDTLKESQETRRQQYEFEQAQIEAATTKKKGFWKRLFS